MPNFDTDTQRAESFENLARKHGFGIDTVRQLYGALMMGCGYQAQFSIPELGGMGQWSSGGMLMIGDMFNNGLKARVADLCADLSGIAQEDAANRPASFQVQHQGDGLMTSYDSWYPSDLGMPSSSGSQNSMRYAFFPSTRRLAISDGTQTIVYDTSDHHISGVSQQQGNGRDLVFSSQHGPVELSTLRKIGDTAEAVKTAANVMIAHPSPLAASDRPERTHAGPMEPDDIITKIERLGALHAKAILTDEEFTAKKAELLARL